MIISMLYIYIYIHALFQSYVYEINIQLQEFSLPSNRRHALYYFDYLTIIIVNIVIMLCVTSLWAYDNAIGLKSYVLHNKEANGRW